MNERPEPTGTAEHPASAAEIKAILGPVDEILLAEIQRVGASAAEVLEAFARLEEDDAVGPVARRPVTARVVAVMTILDAAKLGPDPD